MLPWVLKLIIFVYAGFLIINYPGLLLICIFHLGMFHLLAYLYNYLRSGPASEENRLMRNLMDEGSSVSNWLLESTENLSTLSTWKLLWAKKLGRSYG